MQVICINASNKPAKIPAEKWIKEGVTYTVEAAVTLSIQVGKIGYKLREINLDHSCFPYEYFDSERFAIIADSSVTTQKKEENLFQV